MQWPQPSELTDPWIDEFRSFVAAQDASAFAAREDRNLILMGGGAVSWDATSGTLTWAAQIELLSPNTGMLNYVPAGSLVLEDGQVLRGNVARALGLNASMAGSVAAFALSNDNSVIFCIRRGTKLYWRNGVLMGDGDTIVDLGSSGGSGSSGPVGSLYYLAPSVAVVVPSFRQYLVADVFEVDADAIMDLNADAELVVF